MFVEPDEIAERYRKMHNFLRGEWIALKLVLETGNNNRQTKGIEPRIQQGKSIVERCEFLFLFRRNFFELEQNC